MLIRQGDLMMERIGEAREADQVVETVTLAVGEQSGHSHVVCGQLLEAGLVNIPLDDVLRTEGQPWRHDPIPVKPGLWRFWQQREVTEDEEVRQVAD